MSELAYHYKPRIWHFAAPLIVFLTGWSFIHLEVESAWYLAAGFFFTGICLCIWMTVAGMIQAGIEYHYEKTGQEFVPPEKRSISFTSPRVATWARAILGGRSLAREYWIGLKHGHLFSDDEYDNFTRDLFSLGILRYHNGANTRQGYKINGAEGWRQITRLSQGLLPSPTISLSPIGEISLTTPTKPREGDSLSGGGDYPNTGVYGQEVDDRDLYNQAG